MAPSSEPLYTEFCAIYQGAEAYRLESPAYRKTLGFHIRHPTCFGQPGTISNPAHARGFNQLQALFQQIHLAKLADLGCHRRHAAVVERPRLAARRRQ